MDLEETITHCRKVAEDTAICIECRENHAQVAAWLIELKALRKGVKEIYDKQISKRETEKA